MKKAIIFTLAFLALAATAQAYGPSIHMREADYYVALCELNPLPYPQHNADLLRRQIMMLRLGAIWPDIARVLVDLDDAPGKVDENMVDPHNRHFNSYLLDDALALYPQQQWKLAFALGNLMHNAGDIVAQDMLVQHLAVRGRIGELDVVVGYFDDYPAGEVETFIEGALEFMEPAFDIYREMVDHFLLNEDGRRRLLEVTNFYLAMYEDYFGVRVKMSPQRAAKWVAYFLADPRRIPATHHGGEALYRFALSGCADPTPLADLSIDWDELLRLLGGPAITPAYWDTYYDEGYYLLPPTILLTFANGQGYYDVFPNWSAKMMKSGVIQSLANYLPDQMTVEDGRFVMDMNWYPNDALVSITSIEAVSPPATVTLQVVLYDVPGRSSTENTVTLRVREDSDDATLVASASADVHVDPWTYDVNAPTTLSVEFAPAASIANGATGFIAELALGDDPQALPYFTTDWSLYNQIDEIDMTKQAYTLQYSTYGRWPYSLFIEYPPDTTLRAAARKGGGR